MSRINERGVRVIGGLRVSGGDIILAENAAAINLEATDRRVNLSVDEARKLARDLYRLALRIEKRLGEPRPEA